MALNMSMPLQGQVVAAVAEPYEVTDRDTGQINRGITRKFFVVQATDQEPVEVRVPGTDAELCKVFDSQVSGAPIATPINTTVRVKGNYGRPGAQLVLVELHGIGK